MASFGMTSYIFLDAKKAGSSDVLVWDIGRWTIVVRSSGDDD